MHHTKPYTKCSNGPNFALILFFSTCNSGFYVAVIQITLTALTYYNLRNIFDNPAHFFTYLEMNIFLLTVYISEAHFTPT